MIFAVSLLGQSADSSKSTRMNEKKIENNAGDDRPEFVDLNGDGIDDRIGEESGMHRYGKEGKGRKDRFIDADGDGICDGKESGIGLKKIHSNRRGKHGRK